MLPNDGKPKRLTRAWYSLPATVNNVTSATLDVFKDDAVTETALVTQLSIDNVAAVEQVALNVIDQIIPAGYYVIARTIISNDAPGAVQVDVILEYVEAIFE